MTSVELCRVWHHKGVGVLKQLKYFLIKRVLSKSLISCAFLRQTDTDTRRKTGTHTLCQHSVTFQGTVWKGVKDRDRLGNSTSNCHPICLSLSHTDTHRWKTITSITNVLQTHEMLFFRKSCYPESRRRSRQWIDIYFLVLQHTYSGIFLLVR